MLKLPSTLAHQFDNLLLNKVISDKDRAFYKKWLRFYWDFCHKYQHDAFHLKSLPLFLQKLQDKNQSEEQRHQAKHAISLFFEMGTASEQLLTKNTSISTPSGKSVNDTKVALNQVGNNLSSVVHDFVPQSFYNQDNSNFLSENRPLEGT